MFPFVTHSSPSPLLGEGQVKLKNREFKKLHNILFKKHLVSVIFQKKVYPKNSEQNCSRHTMDNSSSLHSNKTLLTTRPNMRTSINKINKNFKQELKLKTPSTRTINAAQKLNLEKLVFLKIRKRVFSFLWMKNCNNILIIHLQVCCCDAVKKVEQVEKVEQIEQVVGVSQLAFEKFLFVEQSLIFNQIQRIPKHMPPLLG